MSDSEREDDQQQTAMGVSGQSNAQSGELADAALAAAEDAQQRAEGAGAQSADELRGAASGDLQRDAMGAGSQEKVTEEDLVDAGDDEDAQQRAMGADAQRDV